MEPEFQGYNKESLNRLLKHQKEEQEQFEQALRGAYDDPWWRQLVKILKARELRLLRGLAEDESLSFRHIERVRGALGEITTMLNYDAMGQALKEKSDADRSEAGAKPESGPGEADLRVDS